jgi:hypothetical protein
MTGTEASPFYTSPQPVLLAERVMKARHPRACARCGVHVMVGERIGYVGQIGWCHLVPCIVQPGKAT